MDLHHRSSRYERDEIDYFSNLLSLTSRKLYTKHITLSRVFLQTLKLAPQLRFERRTNALTVRRATIAPRLHLEIIIYYLS